MAEDSLLLEFRGARWPCRSGDIIGRDGTIAHEVLSTIRTISRHHLKVDRAGGSWTVVLMPDARNLTWFDGMPMERGAPRAISGEHVVQVDVEQFRLVLSNAAPTTHASLSPGFPDSKPVPPKAQSGEIRSLHGLVPSMPGTFLLLGPDLRIAAATQTATEWFAGGSRPLIGSAFAHLIAEGSAQNVPGQLANAIESGIPGGPFALNPRHRDTLELEAFACPMPEGLLLGFLDVSARNQQARALEQRVSQLENQAKTLALFALTRAFEQGDLPAALSLLTVRCAEAVGCDAVRIWLPAPDQPGSVICRACHSDDTFESLPTEPIPLSYCSDYFDRVRGIAHLASESEDSPVLAILKEIRFAGQNARSLITFAIQQGEEFHGLISMEKVAADGWSEPERYFGLTATNYASLAIQSTLRRQVAQKADQQAKALEAEMDEADRYVRRILPPPLKEGPIQTEWQFHPAEKLGGDFFGYHSINERYFALYVLDVVGHGTGAALLAASVVNTLRSGMMPGGSRADEPAEVLRALNAAFQMEVQGNQTFSIWYGVFDRETRRLSYSSAGHPPALILQANREGIQISVPFQLLGTEGCVIGGIEEAIYTSDSVVVEPGAKLFLLSDGTFEVPITDTRAWSLDEFVAAARLTWNMASGETEYLYKRALAVCQSPTLPDDYSLIRFRFL